MADRLLIIGAKQGSLGECVYEEAQAFGYDVVTAGISGEDIRIDVTNGTSTYGTLRKHKPFHHVVCTAGINMMGADLSALQMQMRVNFFGHMSLLDAWTKAWRMYSGDVPLGALNFVSVSSNSAHIPRSNSAGYCASKAALTMGMQCMARKFGHAGEPFCVWVVEPGWMEGTPMSKEIEKTFPTAHRMPGLINIRPSYVAQFIVNGLEIGMALNGTVHRLDRGEL